MSGRPGPGRHGSGEHVLIVTALAFALTGCMDATGFDRSTDVNDLRILAMRLDPPEVELPLDEDAPPVTVEITALLANPLDEAVTWEMTACGVPGSRGCGAWVAEPGTHAEALSRTESGATELPPSGHAPEALIVVQRELTSELMVELFESASLMGLGGARPAFEIEVEAGEHGERAFKRLQLSLPDIAYRMALHEAGIPICDEDGLPEGCLPYRTRVPNTNPGIDEVYYRRTSLEGPEAEKEPVPDYGPLPVAPGEELTFVPRAAGGSAESYQTLSVDFDDHSVWVEDRTELLIWSWFATAGDFGRPRTEEDRTRGEFNVWTAPSEKPGSEGDVWVWLVLRDNRGGADFTTLHLRVDDP